MIICLKSIYFLFTTMNGEVQYLYNNLLAFPIFIFQRDGEYQNLKEKKAAEKYETYKWKELFKI